MSGNSQNSTLFIHEIPKGLDENDIREHFKNYGEIKNISSHKKNEKTSIRITFDTHENAEKALQNTTSIKGQKVKVSWNQLIQHRPNDHQNLSLIISDFPPDAKPEEREQFIYNQLSPIKPEKVKILKDQKCIVSLRNPHEATIAKSKLSETNFKGQRLKVDFNHRPPNQNNDNIQLPKDVVLAVSPHAHQQQPEDRSPNNQPQQEPIPSPEHVYLSVPVEDGTLFFFDSAENCDAFVKSQSQQGRVQTKVKPQIYSLTIQTLEKRAIYADGFRDSNGHQQEIKQLFETKGKVIRLTPHSSRAVIVQYETEEACKSSYELRHYIDANVQSPLTILPYFIKGYQRPEAGLIQINEFPPTKTISELSDEFSSYGKILATSISPTGFEAFPYGFVFFESYDNAYQAKRSCSYKNVFLYPPLKTAEAIFAFTEGTNAPNNCLVIYDLPSKLNEPEINAKCRNYGQVHSSYVLSYNDKKAAYVYFSQTEDAVKALVELSKENFKCDLLNGNVLDQSSKQLTRIPLLKNWQYLLLFVQNLPSNDYGTSNLVKDIMSLGNLNIDSCFVNLNPLTGVPNGHGIILTRDYQTSEYLMYNLHAMKGMKISYFKANGGYIKNDPAQQSIYSNIKYAYPNVNYTKVSPREYIKLFIQINFDEIKDTLFKTVDQMSVSDTYNRFRELLMGNFIWIDSEVSKIKAT